MKSTLLSIIFFCTTFYASATVRIVDNNGNRPTGTHVYSTFLAAINASAVGDTLLIIPSSSSYGAVIISKSVVVLGVGFNPDKESQTKSSFSSISIQNGISNVSISGVVASSISIGSSSASSTQSNILIEKNQIGFVQNTSTGQNLSNIIIRQNLIQLPNVAVPYFYFIANTQSNIVVSNNIISFSGASSFGPQVNTGGVVFDHNVFIGANNGQPAFYQLVNCTVSNNIFYGKNISSTSLTSSDVSFVNNLVFGHANTSILSGSGFTLTNNLESTNPQFVDMSSPAPFDFSKDLSLQSGSPAKNAGSDGTDLGIYGGSSPYKNSGVSLPVVKSLTLPTTIKQGTNTNATISVNGN